MENTRGRTSRVAAVANNNPPITARPRGAVAGLLPDPKAMGIIPAIIAILVIKMGLMRVCAPRIAAALDVFPGAAVLLAKMIQQNGIPDRDPDGHDGCP